VTDILTAVSTGFLNFLTPNYEDVPNEGTAASFQILSNSSIINHPTTGH
jgi:hypothetical protein